MFILQTVYDTVTEQKCETKGSVQQKIINGLFYSRKESSRHNAFYLFIYFSAKKITFKNNLWSKDIRMKTPLVQFFVDPFPKYETTYDEQCAPGNITEPSCWELSDL